MLNINDLLIDVKANQARRPGDNSLLVEEIFLLWYALLEGEDCESFPEADLAALLYRAAHQFKTQYAEDADLNFIVGWAVSISFWYFDGVFTEEDGPRLLYTAYKKHPLNKLFRWASSQEIGLSDREIVALEEAICKDFDQYYNFGPSIKEYFMEILSASMK
ncbi:MAG: hypothetical protein P0Y53_04505 [Candidatus Pseudobacter hemicellulosilyticus]|uniref:Uncharacterized protein n=1 Tax=Candidatus Pseudobacter hemicellulosilyticus TaxID=3121375 RepID=A0AAJ6BGI9_9BACT|nr:MAG: hypothetical protein P0Y53_04505 [Pseudobacter sp.]